MILLLYTLSAAAAGTAAGAVAGALGGDSADSLRAVLGTILGALAIGMGCIALFGVSYPPLQCDRETPQEWVAKGPVVWPVLNGAALGFGATSRLGFWLWYAVPVGSFLVASPVGGALIWSMYGLTRAGAAIILWYTQAVRPDRDLARFLAFRGTANRATSALMVLLGIALFLLMGL